MGLVVTLFSAGGGDGNLAWQGRSVPLNTGLLRMV
jgi:hypothetical protein